ncbi:MAG: hypothetical protein KGY69_14225 [Bacteroidales bacterium]|nr:hypothetical protein [Bacteroidales bacterium]
MKKHITPEDIGKKLPFQVPENYFKELPDKIMKRCRVEKTGRSLIRILKPALSFAALFIGIALIAYFAVNLTGQSNGNSSHKPEDIARTEYTKPFPTERELIEAFKNNQKKINDQEADQYIDYLLEENIGYGPLIRELSKEQKDKNNEQ